jgi:hypothetical protein
MRSIKAAVASMILAFAMLAAIPVAGQIAPPAVADAAKLDNMPLSQFYLPGTKTIPVEKRRDIYAEASAAYIKKFAREHSTAPQLVEKFTNFLLPTDRNKHNPQGWDTFTGLMDVVLQKGKADNWTGYQVVVLTAKAYQKELDGAASGAAR